MGVALGWMAVAVAMVGAPEAGRGGGVPIKYTVRFVEVEGLGWREAVLPRLTPVARQGAAAVWTAPADVAKRMLPCAAKSPSGRVLQAPTVTAWTGVPAHITTRASRQLATRVSWDGDDRPAAAKPETVRTGSAATLAGRKIDQGILVRMVLEDTQILAVHRVACGGPKAAPVDASAKQAAHRTGEGDAAPKCCEAEAARPVGFVATSAPTPGCCLVVNAIAKEKAGACEGATACCEAAGKDKVAGGAKSPAGLSLALPGPLTYMTDDVRLLAIPGLPGPKAPAPEDPSSHARFVARLMTAKAPEAPAAGDASKKPAPAPGCCSASSACAEVAKGCDDGTVSVEVPEIGSQEIAGEWLIPNDGVLLVSFGPHTVADRDGKAVIRERLAIVEAEEADGPAVAAPALLGSLPRIVPPVFPGIAPPPPPPGFASPSTVPAPAVAMPPMPGRSTPQGYHPDGKAADLPKLPREEAEDGADDSAEARPSPQVKRPRPPAEEEARPRQPSGDAAMKKVQFTLPSLPSLFHAGSSSGVGLQFLLPIQGVSLKLPFDRRLEIEIYGRVVRAPQADTPVLATKGRATTK